MPCHSALLENVVVVQPETLVEKVLADMRKKKARLCVVVDEDGALLGYLDMQILLKNLLPVSLSVQMPGHNADMMVGAAPGIAKRLRKVKPVAVTNVMERKLHSVLPNTPLWEGVQMLVEHGSPIFILDENSDNYIGAMDETTAIAELERMQDEPGGMESHG